MYIVSSLIMLKDGNELIDMQWEFVYNYKLEEENNVD